MQENTEVQAAVKPPEIEDLSVISDAALSAKLTKLYGEMTDVKDSTGDPWNVEKFDQLKRAISESDRRKIVADRDELKRKLDASDENSPVYELTKRRLDAAEQKLDQHPANLRRLKTEDELKAMSEEELKQERARLQISQSGNTSRADIPVWDNRVSESLNAVIKLLEQKQALRLLSVDLQNMNEHQLLRMLEDLENRQTKDTPEAKWDHTVDPDKHELVTKLLQEKFPVALFNYRSKNNWAEIPKDQAPSKN